MEASTGSSASTRSITRPIRARSSASSAASSSRAASPASPSRGRGTPEAPRSQFESQTYGVVELDVDVHDVWRTAQACGFRDLRMCVFHGPPYQVSLDEYEELRRRRSRRRTPGWRRRASSCRHVRSFCLIKGGAERADSRAPRPRLRHPRVSRNAGPVAGQPIEIDAIVTNTGVSTWLASNAPRGGVALGSHLYDEASGALVTFDFHVEPLTDPPREIPARGDGAPPCHAAADRPGRHRLELDCVASHVTWFAQGGSRPAVGGR